MEKRTCTEPNCDKPHLAKGLCKGHYYRGRYPGARQVRSIAKVEGDCSTCGEWFSKHLGTNPVLCETCARAAAGTLRSERAALARDARPPAVKVIEIHAMTCSHCHRFYTRAKYPNRKYCSRHCSREAMAINLGNRNRRCRDCAKSLGTRSLNKLCESCRMVSLKQARKQAKAAGQTRGAAWATMRNHRQRARAYGVAYEPFNRNEVFDRDSWICGICHESIDKRLAFPHLMSVSLDHIVPMVLGGPHTRANVQASHFICNSIKGANMDDETMDLIA